MALVEAVKAGRVESTDYTLLGNILDDLRDEGAEATVVACTEISTLLNNTTLAAGVTVIDPAVELALRTIERARKDAR